MSHCKACHKPITDIAEVGRPKHYCSVYCRRQVERQLKRVKNRLAKLEHQLIARKIRHVQVVGRLRC